MTRFALIISILSLLGGCAASGNIDGQPNWLVPPGDDDDSTSPLDDPDNWVLSWHSGTDFVTDDDDTTTADDDDSAGDDDDSSSGDDDDSSVVIGDDDDSASGDDDDDSASGDDDDSAGDDDDSSSGDDDDSTPELDEDGDGVPASLDCDDLDADVFPGQTAFFDTPRADGSYDYDCDGQDTMGWVLPTWGAPSGTCAAIEATYGGPTVLSCMGDNGWMITAGNGSFYGYTPWTSACNCGDAIEACDTAVAPGSINTYLDCR